MNRHTLTMVAKKHGCKVISDPSDGQYHVELPNGELLSFTAKKLQEVTTEYLERLIADRIKESA